MDPPPRPRFASTSRTIFSSTCCGPKNGPVVAPSIRNLFKRNTSVFLSASITTRLSPCPLRELYSHRTKCALFTFLIFPPPTKNGYLLYTMHFPYKKMRKYGDLQYLAKVWYNTKVVSVLSRFRFAGVCRRRSRGEAGRLTQN